MSHTPRSRRTRRVWSITLTLAMVAAFLPLGFSAQAAGNKALQLNGTSQYATVGTNTSLRFTQFTLETWFKWTGGGDPADTGTLGIDDVIPLVAKGTAETEDEPANINYLFGIDDSSNTLAADFEERADGAGATGLNHPITSSTVVTTGVWHHGAVTYDGMWHLYLDGVDVTSSTNQTVNQPPNDLIQNLTTIGSSRETGGALDGFFQGSMDEVRIWSVARSQAQIQGSMNTEMTSPTTNLAGRWGLDEGTGSSIADSSGNGIGGNTVANPTWVDGFNVVAPPSGAGALQFDGSNDYVTAGTNSQLRLTQFTLEAWFRWNGGGVITSSGSGGVTDVFPLIAKGRSDADDVNTNNVNYLFGISQANGTLAADFEEDASGAGSTGANHPVTSNMAVTQNVWHHAAATYNGTAWFLYLDGAQVGTANQAGPPANAASIVTTIGTSMNSSNSAVGAFGGTIDEVRIWNVARSQAQIQAAMNTEIAVPTSGLLARFGMNETSGSNVPDTSGNAIVGTAVGPTWVSPGAPFAGQGSAPAAPVVSAPVDGATGLSTAPTLDVTVTDPDTDPMNVTFHGRPVAGLTPPDFSLGVLPDTQFYTQNTPNTRFAQYLAQTQWLVDTQGQYNTQFVTHEGDVVQNIDAVADEWTRASQAMSTLENADVPYSIVPGNHDISTTGVAARFDQTFPPSRFEGESWYGGYMGDTNDAIPESTNRLNKDSYQLFEVGNLKFLMVSLEVGMPQYSIDWANALVDAYPDRRVIITTHAFIDASGNRPSSAVHRVDGVSAASVWTQLISPNCNIDFVLNGHYHGEARRNDNNSCGEPVHQILADYQDDPNGGDGWLRMMTFRPELNQVDVITYSPTAVNSTRDPDHDGFEETAAGQFSLPYNMSGNAWTQIGTATNVASGGHATVQWNGLQTGTSYEWYAVANDGIFSTQGPTSVFSTGGTPNQAPVIDSVTINQSNPKTNDTLSATVTSHDPEGSPVNYSYQWLKGGVVISGATNATLNLSGTNNGNKGDQISLRVRGSDGSLLGSPVTSTAVTVANTAPTASVTLNKNNPQDNETLTATATRADTDGDTVLLTYTWKVNGVTRKTTANTSSLTDTFDTSLANNGNQGDTITLAVTPNDGTDNGIDATANAVIGVPNVAPVANGQDQITARNIAKAITLTGSDANFDPITFTVVDNPAHGTLSGTGANRTYTPVASYQGPDSFTFRVNDGVFNSNLATVNIQVAKSFVSTVSDSGFAKPGIGAQLGSIVTWTNIGSNPHNVTDSSGMGLFSSGSIAPNGTFSFKFFAAGNYNYTSTGNGFTAKVKVPVLVSQGSGDTSTVFRITWAGEAPPNNYVYDVQIKRGAAGWANWNSAVTTTRANYTADQGPLVYKFRARLRNASNGNTSAWSAAKAITVI